MTSPLEVTSPSTMETAMRLHRAARLPQAEGLYRQVLRSEPHHFDALHLLGVVCYQSGRHAEAVDLIRRALEQDASAFPALNNLGLAYRALNDLGAARSCFEKAVALQPRYVDARRNLADVLQAQGDLDAAAAELRSVLSLKPDSVVAHFNLGNVFRLRHKLEDAISCYRNALSLDPGLAAAHFSLAKTYEELGRHAEALAGYEKALEIDPRLAEAHAAVGSMLQDQGLIDEALACFRKALSLKPDYVEARWQLVMSQLALAYGPGDDPEAFREAFARELRELDEWLDADRVREGFKGVGVQQPYYLAYHASDNRDLLSRYGSLCTRLMKHWQDEQRLAPAHRAFRHDATQRVRVGIVSAYVYNQSVWTAITRGWCEHLDRNRFAIHLFCPGKTVDDETAFARSRADSFLHGPKSLREWIDAIRSAELDVILYPEIGMDSTTLKLACMRLAPVQLAAWGHPQTTGLPTIDYYLSAEDFEPDDAEAHYTERLVKLPHIGCCYRPLRVRSEEVDLEALGIDPGSLLLVCAGTPYKYDPRHDELLVEIARGLHHCQFLFFHDPYENVSRKLQRRLQFAFGRHDMDFARYGAFAPRQTREAFYGILKRADIYLDTIGFSGFNTAMQAIECELPIVTLEGRYMRGRFGSGILRRMGLAELVAQTPEEYVRIVLHLGYDARSRGQVREIMRSMRKQVFDDQLPIQALEDFLVSAVKQVVPKNAA